MPTNKDHSLYLTKVMFRIALQLEYYLSTILLIPQPVRFVNWDWSIVSTIPETNSTKIHSAILRLHDMTSVGLLFIEEELLRWVPPPQRRSSIWGGNGSSFRSTGRPILHWHATDGR